jgi:hypothetical protein
LEKFNIEKDIAAHIKREFDRKYGKRWWFAKTDEREIKNILNLVGSTWHCVVGRNFGSFVTHGNICNVPLRFQSTNIFFNVESKHFIYFYHGQIAILLFKSA